MIPTVEDFRIGLDKILKKSQNEGKSHIDIISSDLHRMVGGYPNKGNHRMSTCCFIMRKSMQRNDMILYEPRCGKGATFKVRYVLPRNNK